ncbi:hypothetical protein QQ020_17765 [Fulvivirgaceae bacterium BMA12]|uniref:Lipoprotein n=1 Tax=Agaribacillus aureus TaxID=3051825 RepID=A0ABT8L840_9BACT|nr:hypothetical protein [Fulvivirgaceae bacterium BMA12]
MRTFLIIFQILLLFTACRKKLPIFQHVACKPPAQKVNNNLHRVFKPCRQYIFHAVYSDDKNKLISDEYIWLMATGAGWQYQPESQDEVVIQYDFDTTRIDWVNQFSLNAKLSTKNWVRQEVTGVIENGQKTWMHPFRSNQYVFTEVAAFPMVKFPMKTGETWEGNLNIHQGWGKWSDTTIKNKYEVIGYETVETEFKVLNAWHVRGKTLAEFGHSTHDFWYNKDFGFIKMLVKNYENQTLAIELSAVKE